jgi:hypothetical protein
MALLTQLLGNREQATEDALEKGRIWVYQDGNMYSAFCNGFCWRAPGTGCVIIEAWGAAGSGAQMCCCGSGLPGNAPGYTKKCLCVTQGNYVCGYIGRSCNNSSALCFRGCSEASCVCWYGCSPKALYEGGYWPGDSDSFKGNNPWGWGSGGGDPMSSNEGNVNFQNGGNCGIGGGSGCTAGTIAGCCGWSQCRAVGATNGCLCAQGGKGGISYCIDTKSSYICFRAGYFCGSPVGPANSGCCTGDACGMICNVCQDGSGLGFIACGYGGDVNCCGGWSCTTFGGCWPICPCLTQYHVPVAANIFAEEGGVFTYTSHSDGTPMGEWSGGPLANQINALTAMSRTPQHNGYFTCWNNQRSCGCYEMQGCMNYMPYGVPGSAPHPCPGVRDHAGRGGLGAVRIKYIPAANDFATLVGAAISGANPGILTFSSSSGGAAVRPGMVLSGGSVTANTCIVSGSSTTWTLNQAATGTPTTATGGTTY